MYIKQEINFNYLLKNCWSGAIDTLKKIAKENKTDELLELLENMFEKEHIPTITEINDLLWFGDTWVFQTLNIEIEE